MSDPAARVAVVIVTYDSERVLGMCLDALAAQTRPADRIIIVDNRSPHPEYLDRIAPGAQIELVRASENLGFCGGNNLGYRRARDCRYVLFLNPDAFLAPDFIARARDLMERPEHAAVGALSGTLLGFDVAARTATGRIDSTGIFQSRWGKWSDRGRGERWEGPQAAGKLEDVPALCGALMFCRTDALESAALAPGEVFDPRFFMYKEDIDLSLRLRAKGWRLVYVPALLCYHGRGWQARAAVGYRARYLSARNELRVCGRNRWRGLAYSLLKFAYVVALEPLVARARKR